MRCCFRKAFYSSFLLLLLSNTAVSQTLSVNFSHACAINDEGKVYCWGGNRYGQLGNSAPGDPYEDKGTLPGAVYNTLNPSENGLIENRRVKKISAGGGHTCAITEDDLLYCWGRYTSGQIGSGIADNIPFPHALGGEESGRIDGEKVEDVSAGGEHTCAITESKHLYCFGGNFSGQLGRPDIVNSTNSPVRVDDNTYKAVYLGWSHTCAIRTNDELYCWGYNGDGEVGNGSASDKIGEPALVMSNVKTVTAADVGTCAIKNDGTLWCWGEDGTTHEKKIIPEQVESLSYVTAVAMGETHICAIAGGLLYCWGLDQNGSLGLGTPNLNQAIPSLIKNNSGSDGKIGTNFVTEIAGGYDYTCAVAGGAVYCWGNNSSKYLGIISDNTSVATVAAITDIAESECASDPIYGLLGSPCDTTLVGVSGIYVCDSGAIICQNEPTSEICNDGLGNDCNGTTDHEDSPAVVACASDPNFTKINQVCDNSKSGVCRTTGVYKCIAETDTVICNAPKNDGCTGTVSQTPTVVPEETEAVFSPYDPNIENPPSVIEGEEPLPVYVKIASKKAKIYFQWFADFLGRFGELRTWYLAKVKKVNSKPKKESSIGVAIEEQHCQLFNNRKAFSAAQRNCEKQKKSSVRINKVTKCQKVKKCESKGFSAVSTPRKGKFALKRVRKQIITGKKIRKLKKQGKEPNVITVKLKKRSTYSYRYQIVKTELNAKGQIKGKVKPLTPYSKPFKFSTK